MEKEQQRDLERKVNDALDEFLDEVDTFARNKGYKPSDVQGVLGRTGLWDIETIYKEWWEESGEEWE